MAGEIFANFGAPQSGIAICMTARNDNPRARADAPRAELIAIAERAHRLGFSCWRVAIALEASQTELALIKEQIAAANRHDHQQRVADPDH